MHRIHLYLMVEEQYAIPKIITEGNLRRCNLVGRFSFDSTCCGKGTLYSVLNCGCCWRRKKLESYPYKYQTKNHDDWRWLGISHKCDIPTLHGRSDEFLSWWYGISKQSKVHPWRASWAGAPWYPQMVIEQGLQWPWCHIEWWLWPTPDMIKHPWVCKEINQLLHAKCQTAFLLQWASNGIGNPTKSSAVNILLSDVKVLEVCGLGAADWSMRAINEKEFQMTIELFWAQNDWTISWKYSTMALSTWSYWWCCPSQERGPQRSCSFLFAMQTKVWWSKNVLEERSCPDQISLGSMDSIYY